MERLKKEIEERKRKAAEEKAAVGSKYIRRGDLEKAHTATAAPPPEPPKPVSTEQPAAAPPVAPPAAPTTPPSASQPAAERKPHLPRQEVINRLRQRKQPITLFGETDIEREDRLRALEVSDPKAEHTGQENEFHAELEKLEDEGQEGKPSIAPKEDEIKLEITEDSPTEHRIIVKLQGWMREWGEELEKESETMKKTAMGKTALVAYMQTRKYFTPLYRALHTRQVPADVVSSVYEICNFLDQREYLKANDAYLRLAIGNAPWPMGVTAVGIHERSGREKLFTNKVAHIMNDETQRKYIQSIKRIITFLQKKYPNDPSKNMG